MSEPTAAPALVALLCHSHSSCIALRTALTRAVVNLLREHNDRVSPAARTIGCHPGSLRALMNALDMKHEPKQGRPKVTA